MFGRILNVSLPNNLLQLEEGLRRSLPLLEFHYAILDLSCSLILSIYTKHKSNEQKVTSKK